MWGVQIGSGIGHYDNEAARQAEHAQNYADQNVASCRNQSSAALKECIEQAVKAGRENQTSEHDLAAQREMAVWARWMFIATFAQVIVGGIGLGALVITIRQGQKALRAARKANKITRRIGEAQTRCYLSGVGAEIGYLAGGEALIRICIKNAGQSPARAVGCTGKVNHFISDVSYRNSTPKLDGVKSSVDIFSASEERLMFNVLLDFSEIEKLHIVNGGNVLVTVRATITGEDVFGLPVSEVETFAAFISKIPGPKDWVKLERSAKHYVP